MKIKSLQISNVWTFKYYEDINNAPNLVFDKNFNILIGQNGAGKSTVLEVINFIFRRVLFVPYNRNQDLYGQRSLIDSGQKKTILKKIDNIQYYRDFRLDRNYDFENNSQKIKVVVEIDDIDKSNIQLLQDNKSRLSPLVGIYSAEQMFADGNYKSEYEITIELNSTDKTYTVHADDDIGFTYLTAYNLYKEVIQIYNEDNQNNQISNLAESFALIGSYRNYNNYSTHASLGGGNTAEKQIQQIRTNEYSKSTGASEKGEPAIFSLVRLRMASECFNLIDTKKDKIECEAAANELDFVQSINEKLKIVNLKVEIKLIDKSSWNFTFSFIDTKRDKAITDINALSAGQKAIVHLVLEAYGRGDIKGGLVIIDEPEIHLHFQFQNEYLRVIEQLNKQQGCQYILVTHSESLISSETIESVIRVSLSDEGYTQINQPSITTDQKWLVKILDNKRSTHAFFGSKVLLVEGDTDRYFFRAVLGEIETKLKKGVVQDIAIIDINDKKKDKEWRTLFDAFGLKTFFITDLDYAFKFYPTETATKVNTQPLVAKFLADHPDVVAKIEAEYPNGTFVLKEGDLEIYLGIQKDLTNVINLCQNNLKTFLGNSTDSKIQELRMIMSQVTGENESNLF